MNNIIGKAESTDPKPRRKTDEYENVKVRCPIKANAIAEHQERMRIKREEKMIWEF